jgi:hypothetical protein
MKVRLSHRPSPATAIALVSLFVALGGTSYAAFAVPQNSVGTKQLKNNAVTTGKLANHAVTKSKFNPAGVTVPNAKRAAAAKTALHADAASTALEATAVNGERIMNFHQTVAKGTSAQQTVFSDDGLTLTLSCASGEPIAEASSSQAGNLMRGTAVTFTGSGPVGTSNTAPGSPSTLIDPSQERGTFELHYLKPNGQHVDIIAVVDDTNTIGGFDGCLLEGTAIAGS